MREILYPLLSVMFALAIELHPAHGQAPGVNTPITGPIDANSDYQLSTVGPDGKLTGFGPVVKGRELLSIGAGSRVLVGPDGKSSEIVTIDPNVSTAVVGVDHNGNVVMGPDGKPAFVYDPATAPQGKWEGNVYTIDLGDSRMQAKSRTAAPAQMQTDSSDSGMLRLALVIAAPFLFFALLGLMRQKKRRRA